MTIQKILVSIFALCALFLTSCTTVYSRGPTAIVESPEIASSDKVAWNININFDPVDNVELANDASRRPLAVENPPTLGQRFTNLTGASIDLPIRLEVGANLDPLTTILGGGGGGSAFVKYQILGPTYDQMESHSHLLGIASHFSYNSQSISGEQNGIFGAGGYPWSANSHFSAYDIGASYGFRQNDWLMYYTGYAYQIFYIDTNINQSVSSDGTSPAASYNIQPSQGANQKEVLGIIFGKKVKFNLQAAYLNTQWNQQSLNEWSFAFAMNIHIGGN
jgi:hypothetical protein